MANKSTTEYTDRFLKSSDHFHHLLTEEKKLLWILLVVVFTCSVMSSSLQPHGLLPATVHGIPRQEHWNGLPFASPGDLPDPGVEPRSPALQADVLLSEPPGKPRSSTHF